jgi:chromosomal replication initiator protein
VPNKKQDVVYNPFFVYGSTGFGKTHLIQAVGNYIKKTQPHKKVYYLTTDKFQMEVVEQIGKSNRANDFKNKYRKYDILIIDDIQFLAKKEKTQEELFHLFNYLHDNNKQIIFSSDKHPNQISDIEDRLRGRFNAGMTIDIQAPDYESRMEILRQKSLTSQYGLSEKVIEYLATTINGNIRELEGVLNSVILKSDVKERELNLNEVKDLVKNNVKKKKVMKVEEVVQIVSDYYGIDEENVYKKIRKKEFVKPRQLIMFILREDFKISFPTIGEKLGGRDHTTVMHSCEKVREELEDNPQLISDLDSIRSMF